MADKDKCPAAGDSAAAVQDGDGHCAEACPSDAPITLERASGQPIKSERAMKRWAILAKGLLQRTTVDASASSVRQFAGFNLFSSHSVPPPTDGGEAADEVSTTGFEYASYEHALLPHPVLIRLRSQSSSLSLAELTGFDNTGNVCLWPSEEALGHFVLSISSELAGKRVCELAAGMSGLAGLALAIAGECVSVAITDGNERCAQNIAANVRLNSHLFSSTRVSSDHLLWGEHVHDRGAFDVVVAADCLFLTEYHEALLNELEHLLSADGEAILLAPQRGLSLAKFVARASGAGFHISQSYRYNDELWAAHERAAAAKDPTYDVRKHYPECLRLRRVDPPRDHE